MALSGQAIFVLCIMVVVIIAFCSGKVNFAIVALCLPVILQGSGILTAAEAWAGFSNSGVLIFVPLFMLGALLKKSSFMFRLKRLVKKFSKTRGAKTKILFVYGVSAFLLANFMNATACVVIMAPLIATTASLCGSSKREMSKWVADIATCTRRCAPFGMVLAVAGKENALFEAAGVPYRLNTLDPLWAKLPVSFVWFFFMVFIGIRFYKHLNTLTDEDIAASVEEIDPTERGTTLTPAQDKLAYCIFAAGILSMLIGPMVTDIPMLVWGFGFALFAVIINLVTARECLNNMVWLSILIAACMIPLTTALTKTGAQDALGQVVSFLLAGRINIYAIIALFYGLTALSSSVLADTASINIFLALGITACAGLGIDPRPVTMAIEVAALTSILTPMASTQQAVVFGECKFKMGEFVRASIIPLVVYFVIYMLYQPIYLQYVLK